MNVRSIHYRKSVVEKQQDTRNKPVPYVLELRVVRELVLGSRQSALWPG
jgi:hypothetical protein